MDGGALLRVVDSTIADSAATEEGGGIASHGDGDNLVLIVNSTITGNQAAAGGGY